MSDEPAMLQPAQPKFRFHIRTLMVSVALIGIALWIMIAYFYVVLAVLIMVAIDLLLVAPAIIAVYFSCESSENKRVNH